MNLHLIMYKFLLFAPVGSTGIKYSVSLAQGFTICGSNATKIIRIVRFLYIRMRRCFLSFVFISGIVFT